MLTGFDSKWINTLYMDKLMTYENVIQAFSRTNRLFGPDKPFGTIRYYRKPHSMRKNIEEAVRVQGFSWDKDTYDVPQEDGSIAVCTVACDEQTFLTLALRYKELAPPNPGSDGNPPDDAPYDLDGYLTEIDTGHIDSDYMNANFTKWLKALTQKGVPPETLETLNKELHRSFALVTQEEQKYANIFLHDVESGNVELEPGKTLRDYITQYQRTAKDDQVDALINALGINRSQLVSIMTAEVTEASINEYGRFDKLCEAADKARARSFLEE